MASPPSGSASMAVARGRVERLVADQELTLFAAATLAAWVHTVDELRIGELIAVPFGAANAGMVGIWPRLSPAWRAATSIAFGLFWALAAIPYHVIPLLSGVGTAQDVSGLTRVAGGAAMVALGVVILLRRREER
jgi:hypothetical protein